MHSAISSGNRAVTPGIPGRSKARPGGLSAFDIFAAGAQGLPTAPRFRGVSGSPAVAGVRGLDRIERKAARRWVRHAVMGKADALALAWVGVPFAAVFVLGCLTLA